MHMDLEDGIRFPLFWATHDAGWKYLFDLSVAGASLGCAPGDLVLDLGSGTGWASEILNRFGYRTVSLDIDPEAARIARMRYLKDARLVLDRAQFVTADGHKMPFPDNTFDGVICMNALHHMLDYKRVLGEVHRVLKPGCRAAFSEPGSAHSAAPASRMVARQLGEIEKDVVLPEILQLSRECGFERAYLKPYVYPDLCTLDEAGWRRIFAGDAAGTPLDPKRTLEIVWEVHPIFVLKKAGERKPTSAKPSVLRARVEVLAFETTANPPEVRYTTRVTNTGDTLWLSDIRSLGGFVTLGAKILDSAGRLVTDALPRAFLPRDVEPQGQVELSGRISLAGLSPGKYTLRLDMVDELVSWFEEHGPGYVDLEIQV